MKKRAISRGAGLALMVGGIFAVQNVSADAVFVFDNGTAFDGGSGIGATMSQIDGANSTNVTMETADIIDWNGRRASEVTEDIPTLNIGNGGGLAVNSTPNGAWSNEATSINPEEGWVFKFDVDVRLVELDFASQGTDVIAVLSSSLSDLSISDLRYL
ncbi:hypothetical protein P4E94_17050 [Pontiellaceae bacterium B12219]|nr:hypothetical protein [Pontiellaceae bacterium B12219]